MNDVINALNDNNAITDTDVQPVKHSRWMDDYISREDILDIVSQYCADDDGSCSKADVDLREMLDEIEALPTTDVQPVKHGEWSKVSWNNYKCSLCNTQYVGMGAFTFTYCPNCGARMDGDTECQ
jgi:hypothetical protein